MRCTWSFGGAFFLMFVVAVEASAGTYNFSVTTLGDTGDATPGNGVCNASGGGCTLRAAIEESNSLNNVLNSHNVITINLNGPQSGGFALYQPATPYRIRTAADSDSVITIVGRSGDAGPGLFIERDIIDGGNATRLFGIGDDEGLNRTIKVVFYDFTIRNGRSGAGTICPSAPNGSGGAMQICRKNPLPAATGNVVEMTRIYMHDNTSTTPSALAGGAVFIDAYSTLNSYYSAFSNNQALGTGTSDTSAGGAVMGAIKSTFDGASNYFVSNSANTGGAAKSAGWFNCSQCVFYDNKALGTGGNGGGALYLDSNFGVSSSLNGSFFLDNFAQESGGAIWTGAYALAAPYGYGVLNLFVGYFVGNVARGNGGAVFAEKPTAAAVTGAQQPNGSAEVVDTPFLHFNNVLFYQNHAGVAGVQVGNGGAIYSELSATALSNSTFDQNTATGSGAAVMVLGCSTSDSAALMMCGMSDQPHYGKMNGVTLVDNHDLVDEGSPVDAGGAGLVVLNGNGNWEMKIANSVLASNNDSNGPGTQPSNCHSDLPTFPSAKFFSAGHNLFGTSIDPPFTGGVNLSPCPAGFRDATDVQSATYDTLASLGLSAVVVGAWPAAVNGAATDYVMTPQPGSVLLDSASPIVGSGLGECLNDDALATARPQNGRCDIGAVERVIPPPTFQFSAATSSVSEEAGTHTITVTLSAAYAAALTVPFSIGGATTASGAEYVVTTPSPLSFAIGETSKTISFTLTGDAVLEGNEQVVVILGAPSAGAVLGTPSTHTATLIDDEAPQPPIITLPAGPFTTTDTNPVLIGTGASVTDFDSVALTLTVTLVGGTADVSGPAGIVGNGSGSLTLTGTPADISTTLQSLTLTPNNGSTQIDVSVFADDGGLTDTETLSVAVTITPPTTPPVVPPVTPPVAPMPSAPDPVPPVLDVDSDQDGVADGADNCVSQANPDQADRDGDGAGDVCDRDANNDGFYDDVGASGGGILHGCSATGTDPVWWALVALAATRRRRKQQ